ncbi:hypothetical protein QO034_13630 [Sedimentitalea sp. JM2-8]|uniref:Poly(3-hydroxyalkanoate) polymerase subunit PhaE n=1 Tax=Sedimentitalea xiamensis TaxID=3050037 RepID=A0ABT7FG87_9RHOB|nr:hypothetical protein [Sedimentitalea xiamensis]MDK3074156.1 hypothetical protein [Sedimentitalea xiamensis]
MTTDKPDLGGIDDVTVLSELYADMVQGWISAFQRPGDDAGGDVETDFGRDVMELLARAQIAWLNSGLRYGRQISDLMLAHKGDLGDFAEALKPPADGPPDRLDLRQTAMIDTARRLLQQVADASLSEAEALRAELLKIEAELRSLQNAGADAGPRRNVRIKR